MLRRLFGGGDPPEKEGERGEKLPADNEGPPDSRIPNGVCPRCGKVSSFELMGSLPMTFESSYMIRPDGSHEVDLLDRVSSLKCRNCNHCVVVIEEKWIGDVTAREWNNWQRAERKTSGVVNYRGIYWWPIPSAHVSSDVPIEIAEAFKEAVQALSANCPRASAVMARRTLEAVTVDKGQTTGQLWQRLQNLATAGTLHPSLADWVREVRLVGNHGAHFDPLHSVSLEDARQLTQFLKELLRYLYELPAELARRRSGSNTS